jgi:methylase of polypeptide subunit release factors
VPIAALGGARIHPHYGVFSPVRGEYLDLLGQAALPPALECHSLAFDIGTGSGVIAALLARRGVQRVVATDLQASALASAAETVKHLGFEDRIALQRADLFPTGGERAALIVCNPPWLPAKPTSPLEAAIYDPDSRMLKGFLAGLALHLAPGGEGWLILSDLAEHLGLRSRAELLSWIEDADLKVLDRHDMRPRHAKAQDSTDPLHAARRLERTSLWRLGAA